MDKAVMKAYGFSNKEDILSQLLALNFSVAEKDPSASSGVQAPGLPEFVKDKESYVSEECGRFRWE